MQLKLKMMSGHVSCPHSCLPLTSAQFNEVMLMTCSKCKIERSYKVILNILSSKQRLSVAYFLDSPLQWQLGNTLSHPISSNSL